MLNIGRKFKSLSKPAKLVILVTILILGLLILFAFTKFINNHKKKLMEPVVPVKIAAAVEKPIEITFGTFGNIKAYSTVAVKSRISGPIVKMESIEGKKVKENDLLLVVDPRPFEAQLQRVEANQLRDQALLEKAKFDFENYSKLVKTGAVSQEQFQAIRSTKSTLEATIKGDEADLQSAKLQLGYTEIRAPIDGVAGDFLTDLGTVVKADETELVVINQIQPIFVNFSVPGTKIHEIKEAMQQEPVKVRVSFPNKKKWIEEGKIVFIDNEIDSTTGTILMKAEFSNKSEYLVPGEYLSIELVLQKIPKAIVIPSEAIQKDSHNNTYVYIVKNLQVERRNIKAISISESESWVSEGLMPGEQVITDGIFQVVPGSKVKIQ